MMDPEDEVPSRTVTEACLRQIADEISDYRKEALQKLIDDVMKEADEVATSGFDPGRGPRGRGPWWADGG